MYALVPIGMAGPPPGGSLGRLDDKARGVSEISMQFLVRVLANLNADAKMEQTKPTPAPEKDVQLHRIGSLFY